MVDYHVVLDMSDVFCGRITLGCSTVIHKEENLLYLLCEQFPMALPAVVKVKMTLNTTHGSL